MLGLVAYLPAALSDGGWAQRYEGVSTRPGPGLWLRGVCWGELSLLGETTRLTLSVALLAATTAAPEIRSLLSGLVNWLNKP